MKQKFDDDEAKRGDRVTIHVRRLWRAVIVFPCPVVQTSAEPVDQVILWQGGTVYSITLLP